MLSERVSEKIFQAPMGNSQNVVPADIEIGSNDSMVMISHVEDLFNNKMIIRLIL